ncbi:uncharacterized protein VP01_1939g7 [Puccinia sorghi]|uniref:Uncharacterized protein n=1 Tax=Puccinia sorghi TaxID=27349 RepID=A0A0L6VE62_9BASI|nr:uncharacterized protein VP01_1939g7 [Puccinia sorghi]
MFCELRAILESHVTQPVTGLIASRYPDENLLLNQHPNVNFLSSVATPIPSFPKALSLNSLKKAQRQSEFNFISNFIQPNQSPSNKSIQHASSSKIRLVDQDQSSTINLPYPNPDLSTITSHHTIIDHPTPARRISALPSRAQTPFKLFKPQPSPSTISNQPQSNSPAVNQHDRSPLSNKLINASSITSPSSGKHDSPSKELISPNPVISPRRLNFPTPSAALSDIFKSQDQPALPSSNTIDQVMAELESRAQAGPRITKISFQGQQGLQANQAANDRFHNAHGKQFAKYDSITNHYAAKRKNDATSINTRSVTNPSKRAKVSDFGYPKKLVSQQELDTQEAERKKEVIKRQLELARSRRRTGGGTSSLAGSKPSVSKPTPSGFSSFGTRLLKSAVKTVAGAFKGSEKLTSKVDGVGFAPAGLGVGPAKVPAPAPPPAKRTIGRPTRIITKPPLSRLPPAGHRRLLSTTSSASNTLSEVAHRRIVSGPPAASANFPGDSKIPSRGTTTRAQAIGATKPTTALTKSTWQPKTLPPQPTGPSSSRINRPTRSRQTTQTNSPNKNTNPTGMCTRTRIPKMSTQQSQGQMIIRPSVKSGGETRRRTMMTSTSTTASGSSTRSHVRMGLSAKTVPNKLSQPVRPTKPIGGQSRLATLRRPPTAGPRASLTRKSSAHPSRVLPHKGRNIPSADLPKRKILLIKTRRRSSFKHVGTKAVSHRVSSS